MEVLVILVDKSKLVLASYFIVFSCLFVYGIMSNYQGEITEPKGYIDGKKFSGYESNNVRVESLDLDDLFDILDQRRHKYLEEGDWKSAKKYDYIHGTSQANYLIAPDFLDTKSFEFYYKPRSDETPYNFRFNSSKPEIGDKLWERMGFYLELNSSQLEHEKNKSLLSRSGGDTYYGGQFKGSPNWTRVFSDAGNLLVNDTTLVGYNELRYDSSANVKTYTEMLSITQKNVMHNGTNYRVTLEIDRDSDIRLFVGGIKRMEDPSILFDEIISLLEISIPFHKFEYDEIILVPD